MPEIPPAPLVEGKAAEPDLAVEGQPLVEGLGVLPSVE